MDRALPREAMVSEIISSLALAGWGCIFAWLVAWLESSHYWCLQAGGWGQGTVLIS